MQNNTDAYAKAHERKNIWKRIVTVLSCLVVFCTTYALILPAITASDDTFCGFAEHTHSDVCFDSRLVCGLDESDEHTHSDACYEKVLVCDEQEHEHTLACYSDPEADKESAAVWERSVPDDLGDNWAENVAAVAVSQIGYAESEHNFTVQDGNMNGYTRYGDWYGKPYDGWSAMFASFCLHYAGIPETDVPYGSDCEVWAADLERAKLYKQADKYSPQAGDVVFFDTDEDGIPDAAGIFIESGTDVYDGSYIVTVDGDSDGTVCKEKHFAKDRTVLGYCAVPENPDAQQPENEQTEDLESVQFEYEDSELAMSVSVESAEPIDSGVTLAVETPEPGSTDFQSLEETGDELQRLILRSVSLMKNGEKLDTDSLRITAEVELKQSVLEPLAEEMAGISDAAPESEIGIVVSALQTDEEQNISETESVFLALDEQMSAMTVPVQNGVFALRAGASANPHYTVQYYAYIPRFAESGDTALTVFDTSGGILPTNDPTQNRKKSLYISKTGEQTPEGQNAGVKTDVYRIATVNTLTQMYSDNQFEYIKAPNTSYVNKLIDNDSFDLAEVWVLLDGKSPSSTNKADWKIYNPSDVHFTNRSEAAADNIIYISENTCIRLVYTCHQSSFTAPSTFYDYDISSGQNSDGKWLTGITGINQQRNYTPNANTKWTDYRDIIAFGNANCGTGMANYKFDGVYLNKHSGVRNNYGCTFGLAKGLSDGKIVYNDWIIAPKLFNDGSADGKHTYEGSSLTFSKVGDTYTLSSANVNGVGSISGLEKFNNPSPKTATTHAHIFTNNFWPLDAAASKTDPVFGSYSNPVYYKGYASADNISGTWAEESKTLPYSDDGRNHNSFFGLQYAVSFTLTEDYMGPLEYYFFGDDDMWVFLDNRLVCDIGGVHSSVGEYVNLWDYLNVGEAGTHTLTFFYTERGASGSTCYMSFTLPSVSGVNIEQKTSELRVSKTVMGEDDPTKEFDFDIRFYDSSGNTILDDYAYSRYAADGKELETDLIIHDGGSFSLRTGEYVIIKYLPYGLRYTVKEHPPSGYTVTNSINGIVQPGNSATGTIIMDTLNEVRFTNTLDSVGLTLQKLGPEGESLSGAVFGLSDSSGNAVEFVADDSEGSYTVAERAGTRIQAGELYYIAAGKNSSYVIGEVPTDQYAAQLQSKTGSNAQKFRVYKQADGSYSFRCEADGRWLDLDNGKLEDGNLVHFWANASTPTSHDNQKWFLLPNSDGTFTIKPRVAVLNKSAAVLDLNGAAISEGARIQVWTGNSTDAQKWLLVPVNAVTKPTSMTKLTVGADGVLRLSGLLPGSYTLTELQAPDGCVKLDDPVRVHIDANGAVTVSDSALVTTDTSGGVSVVKVVNKYTDRELTLEKQVTGSDTRAEFEFTVSYTTPDGVNEEKTVSLSNGEREKISIPYNSSVTITEKSHDGFALSFMDGQTTLTSDGDSCTFKMKQDVTVTAVNAAGYELPASGGIGTALYTFGGVLLIAAAGFLLYKKASKRRNDPSA